MSSNREPTGERSKRPGELKLSQPYINVAVRRLFECRYRLACLTDSQMLVGSTTLAYLLTLCIYHFGFFRHPKARAPLDAFEMARWCSLPP